MAYTSPATAIAGSVLTAAWLNTYLRDNEIALRAGGIAIASQANLDFLYASGASQLARLAAGTAYQVPRINSAGTGWEFADGSARATTWPSAPVLGGAGGTSGQSYNAQVGRYYKNGTLVVAHFHIDLTTKGTITGVAQIQNLPFTAHATDIGGQLTVGYHDTLAGSGVVWIGGQVNAGTTTCALYVKTGQAAAVTAADTSHFANGSELYGTIVYESST